ncbi:hypothetical protein FOZ60_014327 [Perkinsus olseni]|uniref:Uncharacterized protein n=1 Tax=Perkinsus olseni TaxID=32597 RepID=A0A7J6P7H1_PEROL|nr:hypothetical protein FOZ60_014327 [Perkinsus olseni]
MEVGSDEGSDTSSSSSSSESEDGDEGGRGLKRRERFGWPRFVKFARPGVGSRTLLDQTLREEVVRVRDRFTKYQKEEMEAKVKEEQDKAREQDVGDRLRKITEKKES